MTCQAGSALPLAGVRILELAAIGPVPFAGRMLCQLGAEVQVVMPPSDRGVGIPLPREQDPFALGKSTIVLDLKSAQGRDHLMSRLVDSDALLEGFRPGTLERLGLPPNTLLEANPRLVVGRCGGWGRASPRARSAGHDINYLALTGALHAIGPAEAPVPPLNLVGDFGGAAMHLALGVVAALLRVRDDGHGGVVDTSILEGSVSLMSMIYGLSDAGMWSDEREANLLDGGAPYYACYATADDRWMALGAIEAKFFADFVARSGARVDVARQNDRRYWPEMRAEIARCLKSRSRDEWDAVFRDSDACCTPVLDLDEARTHPDMQWLKGDRQSPATLATTTPIGFSGA
jgi:alpha-methylacyl-CoA racemase